MRKKENRSRERESRASELKKTVRKSADKDHESNEQIMLKLCFKVVEDQNRYTKEDQRKRYVK